MFDSESLVEHLVNLIKRIERIDFIKNDLFLRIGKITQFLKCQTGTTIRSYK